MVELVGVSDVAVDVNGNGVTGKHLSPGVIVTVPMNGPMSGSNLSSFSEATNSADGIVSLCVTGKHSFTANVVV